MSSREAPKKSAADDESALRVARKCRADIDIMLRTVSKMVDSSKHALDVQTSTIAAMQTLFTAIACRLPEVERNAIAADLRAEASKFIDPAPGIKVKPVEARAARMLVDAANYITEIQAPEAEIVSKTALIVREESDDTTAFDRIQQERHDALPEHPEDGR